MFNAFNNDKHNWTVDTQYVDNVPTRVIQLCNAPAVALYSATSMDLLSNVTYFLKYFTYLFQAEVPGHT